VCHIKILSRDFNKKYRKIFSKQQLDIRVYVKVVMRMKVLFFNVLGGGEKKMWILTLSSASLNLSMLSLVYCMDLILHMLPALVVCTVTNAFKHTINLKSLHLGR
jgi:hypothetical protein